jgi:predicted  nucleic acid-binding Zn-ribbon protein
VSDEERARFEVLLERIETKIDVIAEGHIALTAKVDAIAVDTTQTKERLEMVDLRLASLEHKTGKIESRVGKIESRVGRLEGDMHAVKDHLGLNGVSKTPKLRGTRPAKK